MAISRPLAVAVAAMALLVASVGFEVVFHRTYALDVQTPDGWVTIATTGTEPYRLPKPGDTMGADVVQAPRDGSVTFRIRADNGYPWALSEDYDARVGGVIVAEGVVQAEARSQGVSTFDVRAALFFSPGAREPTPAGQNLTFAYLDVQVGDRFLGGNFALQEAS